ncbi:hypothetical protein B0H21DRAFT_845189, partial [Amylocystis lapponica]
MTYRGVRNLSVGLETRNSFLGVDRLDGHDREVDKLCNPNPVINAADTAPSQSIMSFQTKQPMSGLRRVRHSLDTDAARRCTFEAQDVLSGLDQRMKNIQDALNERKVSDKGSEHRAGPTTLQKRPSSSLDPPAKRRQLPSSWTEVPSSGPLGTNARAFGSSRVNGSAGTGKSVLLREIIKTLRRKYTTAPDAVAITASTGIGLGRESAEQLSNKILKNRKASGRWARTKVLIIDEVSMVEGELFDKLARI